MWENGNSRNGYHKVKCQVPETEELRGREKGRKQQIKNSYREKSKFIFYWIWKHQKRNQKIVKWYYSSHWIITISREETKCWISTSTHFLVDLLIISYPINWKLNMLFNISSYSLVVNILCVHPAIELGQFHSQDDARQQEEGAAAQAHPESVLTTETSH